MILHLTFGKPCTYGVIKTMSKTDLFTDEDEEEIVSEEDDIFADKEETNIFAPEKEEETEEDIDDDDNGIEPETTEELDLADLGIVAQRFKGFKKRYPSKNIFYNGKLTKFAFKWYIANCSEKELKAIKESKLPEGFNELLAKKYVKELGEQEDEIIDKKDESLVAQYIEKNAELIKEKDDLFKKIQKLQKERDQFKKYSKVLYKMNYDMLLAINKHKLNIEFTKKTIKQVEKIKEDLK